MIGGRVEKHDDVIHSVEMLEPREFTGILMGEGSDLVGPRAYLIETEYVLSLVGSGHMYFEHELECGWAVVLGRSFTLVTTSLVRCDNLNIG